MKIIHTTVIMRIYFGPIIFREACPRMNTNVPQKESQTITPIAEYSKNFLCGICKIPEAVAAIVARLGSQ